MPTRGVFYGRCAADNKRKVIFLMCLQQGSRESIFVPKLPDFHWLAFSGSLLLLEVEACEGNAANGYDGKHILGGLNLAVLLYTVYTTAGGKVSRALL